MADADVCWRQRFDNFQRALQVLERGVELARQRPLSELEQQGLIQGLSSAMNSPGICSRTTYSIRGLPASSAHGMPPAWHSRTI